MDIDAILEQARSGMTAERVYATPIERDGLTVIPAAKVMGGGGGGTDESDDGGGAGFGLNARPAGALIVEPDGRVRWKPFLDWSRVIAGSQLVVIACFVSVWLTRRSEARAAMKAAAIAAGLGRTGRTSG